MLKTQEVREKEEVEEYLLVRIDEEDDIRFL